MTAARLRELGVRVTLPYPPSANQYWRVDRRGFTYVSDEAKDYKKAVKFRLLASGIRQPLDGPLVLSLVVYRPLRKGDLSNRIKVLEDAFNGIVWKDDSQVVEIHARREDDKANPRVEVRVDALEGSL